MGLRQERVKGDSFITPSLPRGLPLTSKIACQVSGRKGLNAFFLLLTLDHSTLEHDCIAKLNRAIQRFNVKKKVVALYHGR